MSQPIESALIQARDLLAHASHDGPIWSASSEQLNVNLIRLSAGQAIVPHINADLDVLIVVIAGVGRLTLDQNEQPMRAGDLILIPRGTLRGIVSVDGVLAYLSCHRRRAGLMPT